MADLHRPKPLLDFLRGRASERSLRLFACACVERCRDWLVDERSRKAVETARCYADRLVSEDELRRDRETARLAWLAAEDATWRVATRQGREFGVCRAAQAAFWAAGDKGSPALDAAVVALHPAALAWSVRVDAAPAEEAEQLRRQERRCQCDLLCCIAGNPCCVVSARPSPLALRLVEVIYAGDQLDLPIPRGNGQGFNCIERWWPTATTSPHPRCSQPSERLLHFSTVPNPLGRPCRKAMVPILQLLRAAAGSDRDLLGRYVRDRDEQAFEALVQRYGAGVWAACVRLAARDAEDAFQAVFLLLSRKAGTVTGSLPAWLHAVTRRVASDLRRSARRRGAVEAAAARPAEAPPDDLSLREGLAVLDEELSRLPERHRAVLIVCCLEGRSRDEAAAQLGWSEAQVKGRLQRAREMLRARLARRGVELGGLLLAAAVAGPVPVRADPPSAAALTLSHGVIRAMLIQKLRLAVVVLAAFLGVALAGGVMLRAQPGDPAVPGGGTSVPPLADHVGAAGPQGNGESPKGQIDETARKEIESLRKRVEALERMQKQPAPQRQKVVVTSPLAKDIVVAQQYAARIRAHRHINLSALASGAVLEVAVKEGQAVKQGDVLFRVLPTLSQARLDAERAEVQLAQLALNNAKKLFEQKVVTKQEVALYEAKLAKAQAKARLAEAELNFTVVKAPFDGLVGRMLRQQGSVVKEGDALTTLSDTSLMWVYFNVPEARYLEYVAARDRVKVGTPVDLVLANGDKYPEAGKLGAIAAGFENDTGNIPFRADFPNPKGLLRHGQTGKVLLRESLKNAVLIPQRATFEVLGKRYVFVIGKDDVVHRREIAVRHELEGLFVVSKGLEVNDRIVVEGVRQVRDGEKVVGYEYRKPEEVMGNAKKPAER